MSGLNSLAVRDILALCVICTMNLTELVRGTTESRSATDIVRHAFEVADEFMMQSEGKWADNARASRRRRSNGKP